MARYNINGDIITEITGISALLTKHIVDNPNLAKPATFEVGLLETSGNIKVEQTGCRTTDFIPVKAGRIVSTGYIKRYTQNPWFKCTEYQEYYRAYVFYGSDKKTVVSAVSESTANSSTNAMDGLEVPENATYVRISWASQSYNDPVKYPEQFFVCIADEPVTNPTYYFENGVEKAYIKQDFLSYIADILPYTGKTWTLFGDSLTDDYGGHDWKKSTSPVGGDGWKETTENVPWTDYFWASRIARETGLTLDNRAASGSNIYVSRVYTDVSGIYKLDEYITELEAGIIEQSEIITVGFGSNTVSDEINQNAVSGAENGRDANGDLILSNLYGGTMYFIEKIREKSPMSRLVFILMPRQEGWRQTDGEARTIMKQICDEYNVEYVDMWDGSGITVDMLPDKLHVSSREANNAYYNHLKGIFGL